MAQAHDYANGADANFALTQSAAKTVYDANGVPAVPPASGISHDEGTGANPHLLVVGAAEQVCQHPLSFANWTAGGTTLTDLGQDGIFRKGRVQSGGQGWHSASDQSGSNDTTVADQELFAVTCWYDPNATVLNRLTCTVGGGGFCNVNDVNSASSSNVAADPASYQVVSQEVVQLRADMYRKTVVLRNNSGGDLVLEGIIIRPLTTDTSLYADYYGAQLTNLGYYDGAINGYSRAADVITPAAVTARTLGALVARYDALHGSGDIIGLRSNAAAARRMAIARNETANQIQAVANDGTAEIANLGAAQTDAIKHVAFGFDQDDFAASIDNAAALTDTAGTFGPLDELYIGDGPGVIKLYAYSLLDTRPSDADLATLVAGEAPAAGVTAQIGLASEASAGQALAGSKTAAFARGDTSDQALPLAAAKVATITPALGTDQAPAIGAITLVELGLASESASAFALTSRRAAQLGVASTIDIAPALGSAVLAQIGLASEISSANAVEARKAAAVTPALETQLGFDVAASKVSALGQAETTDLPLALRAQLTALVPSARRTHVVQRTDRTVIV